MLTLPIRNSNIYGVLTLPKHGLHCWVLKKCHIAAVSKACSRSASSTAALQLLYGNLEPKQIWRLLAYSGWLRNPAPVDGLSHDFFRVSTILLVQDFATIHSTAGNWFLARNIRNGLKVPWHRRYHCAREVRDFLWTVISDQVKNWINLCPWLTIPYSNQKGVSGDQYSSTNFCFEFLSGCRKDLEERGLKANITSYNIVGLLKLGMRGWHQK